MIVLDTCTLLWLTSEPEALSEKAKRTIRQHRGTVFVSAISAFEIGQKVARKKLTLPFPISDWFPSALRLHGLTESPVTGAIAALATELPDLHRDPFDRFLIATAQSCRWKLITPDPMIHQYPDSHAIW